MAQKMVIILTLENERLEEHTFSSFSEMCESMKNKKEKIHSLQYDNKDTKIQFCWNKEELANRGYIVVSDICDALKNNTFVIR